MEVDIDGNVSLRGNQNVAVMINGRPVMLSGDALATFLQSLPANSIERIEVIPNPSAKYDPDGMSGIINIVLKQNTDRGLSGAINGGIGTPEAASIGANLSYGSGPWSIFANYGFNLHSRDINGYRFQENHLVDPFTEVEQFDTSSGTRYGHSLSGSIDYAFDPMNSISLNSSFHTRDGSNDGLTRYTDMTAMVPSDLSTRNESSFRGGLQFDNRLSYRWVKESNKNELSVEGRFASDRDLDSNSYGMQDLTVEGIPVGSPVRTRESTDELNRTYSLQADYVRPLWSDAHLESGYKGSLRSVDNTYNSSAFIDTAGEFVANSGMGNQFNYREHLEAVYAIVGQTFGDLQLQAGVRAEQANTTFTLKNSGASYDNSYFSLFPSAFLMWQAMPNTQLKLSYSRRIERPGTWEMNPFNANNDPNFRYVGNPYLQPEYEDAYELGLNQHLPFGMVSLTPYYRHESNMIERVETFDSSGVATMTWANYNTNDAYGADAVISARLGELFTGFASASAYRWITDASNLTDQANNDAFGWSVRANGTFNLPWDLALQATWFYRAPMNISGGQISGFTHTDVALEKKLMEDRLKIGVRVRDPFDQGGFSLTRTTPEYHSEMTRDWQSRGAMLTLSYTFGTPQRQNRPQASEGGDNGGGEDIMNLGQ